MNPLENFKAQNSFQAREIQKARILGCYSNVGQCIPAPIKKAEEAAALEGKADGEATKEEAGAAVVTEEGK